MSTQTRTAFLAEYRAAFDSGSQAWIAEVMAAATAYDREHPFEPSLADELVLLVDELAALDYEAAA
ncbi:hypothetical protein [Streptomyces chartreusis]|uniref:hypothetical protein n=1 Tax=Streptomyces chartreusis TaxID=1969 RepID=UPI00123CAE7F|nr:hypothetical protein [Streptomyces chartreusis]QEV66238.1 hypothetical protein CP983_05875 [Streptomyces chartreusis]GGW98860.1 hypothetical protein GCM10010321_11640 [Streptomyces chartreusis]